jgi:hypothetical protein
MITEGQIKRQADALRAEIASLQVCLDQEEEMGVARQREIAILRDGCGRREIELGECQATLAEIKQLYTEWSYAHCLFKAADNESIYERLGEAEAARDAVTDALERLVASGGGRCHDDC